MRTILAAALALAVASPALAQQSMRMGDNNAITTDAKIDSQAINAKGANSTATGSVAGINAANGVKIGDNNAIMLKGKVPNQNVMARDGANASATVGGINAGSGIAMGDNNAIVTDARVNNQTVSASGHGASASGNVGGIVVK